jgi:hypothetical protein
MYNISIETSDARFLLCERYGGGERENVTTEDAKYADLSMGMETERQRDRKTERQRDREGTGEERAKCRVSRVWMRSS